MASLAVDRGRGFAARDWPRLVLPVSHPGWSAARLRHRSRIAGRRGVAAAYVCAVVLLVLGSLLTIAARFRVRVLGSADRRFAQLARRFPLVIGRYFARDSVKRAIERRRTHRLISAEAGRSCSAATESARAVQSPELPVGITARRSDPMSRRLLPGLCRRRLPSSARRTGRKRPSPRGRWVLLGGGLLASNGRRDSNYPKGAGVAAEGGIEASNEPAEAAALLANARDGDPLISRARGGSRSPACAYFAWVTTDRMTLRKNTLARSSSSSRMISALCRRSNQGEMALRKRDFSSLRPPLKRAGARRVFGR